LLRGACPIWLSKTKTLLGRGFCVGAALLLGWSAKATDVTLAWNANTESDLAGYFIYYAPTNSSVQRADAGRTTSITLRSLSPGTTYKFYATAYNTAGLESDPSQQVIYKVPDNITPQDSGAMFQIVGIVDNGAGEKVQFKSVSGDSYAVDMTDGFPGGWQTLASGIAGTGGTVEINDATAGNSTKRIYRIRNTPSTGSVTSAPAGFQRLSFPANSDTLASFPYLRPAAAFGQVASVSGATVQVSGTPGWAANQWVYGGAQTNTYFLLFRTGVREGDYYTITNNGSATLSLDLQAANLTGVGTGDYVSLVPYWTLGTAFPAAQGVNSSPTPANRQTEVLLPDVAGIGIDLSSIKTYYFWNGAWRAVGEGTVVQNDDVILPDMPIWVRQNSATATQLTTRGAVLTSKLRLAINRTASQPQDNIFGLPRPVSFAPNTSGLIESGAFRTSADPANPLDLLFFFDSSTAKNKAASGAY
jgi:uncharacterized protein (TIGR02597 family)